MIQKPSKQTNILVFNCGSSSIKFSLIDLDHKSAILSGNVEKITEQDCTLSVKWQNNKTEKALPEYGYREAIGVIIALLSEYKHLEHIVGIGHRVVHGGQLFSQPVKISDKVIQGIKEVMPLAPLHNFANLEGILAAREMLKGIPQTASFDTAFHQSIPELVYLYALPRKLYAQNQVRKYGFHGISHAYVTQKASQYLSISQGNYISAHLGNGCSVTAVKQGKSIDTSMGLTPLDGLVMGTRSGTVDPGIFSYLHSELKLDIAEITNLLNRESGLAGLCGLSDMRDIEAQILKKDPKSETAFDIFCHRLAKYIASYMLYFDQLDGLIFTGGIGENSALVRQKVASYLTNIGFVIDRDANQAKTDKIRAIHRAESQHSIFVIPTDEARMIAEDCHRIINPVKAST